MSGAQLDVHERDGLIGTVVALHRAQRGRAPR